MPEPQTAFPKDRAHLRFVARQPIFDVQNHLHGYELLYRRGTETQFCGESDQATRVMLDNTLLFGMDALAGNAKAFINCTRNALLHKLVTLLPPSQAVLEILEDIEPDPDILKAIAELRDMGYKIALDDFVFRPCMEAFLPLSDYIKIDFLQSGPEERAIVHKRISGQAIKLLAEKVETVADFKTAVEEGYELFQGYYFCRPAVIASREIPPNRLNYLAILRAMHKDPLDLGELESLVKRDAALCYRLLRLVNSALFGLRQEVTSIKTALLTIGDQQFRKLASIAITTELGEKHPDELLVLALARARFCELGAKSAAEDPTEQYLLGLFSLLPAIMQAKVEDLLPLLPFRPEIQEALQGKENETRRLLGCFEHYEQGDWQQCMKICTALGTSEPIVAGRYAEAIRWAEQALSVS